jgi:tetratricopeptide (TPR) repeat protein
LDDAVTWYQKTLELDPRRAVAYANLGDAYADLHRPADARRSFEKFLELQPRSKIAPRVRQSLAALPATP